MPLAIWWIRRDLRLHANAALNAALRDGFAPLPLFILDPHLLHNRFTAPQRGGFLSASLHDLAAALEARGAYLLVRRGDPLAVLRQVLAESGATRIYAEEDYTPYARRRDARVARDLPLVHVLGLTVHHPDSVRKPDGTPYTVFTPFSRAWKALPLPSADAGLSIPTPWPPVPRLPGDPLPEMPPPPAFPAGEAAAQARLQEFLAAAVYDYAVARNRLDLDGTSRLSPYLRFGLLSARQVVQAARNALTQAAHPAARRGVETFINELIWREFYHSILYHFPQVVKTAFRPAYRDLPWRTAPEDLRAWQEGRTGYPIVDACMRQLQHEGWMHNRGRMIVASFLVKDLLINWQEGERWFMQHLVDGDIAANNGGWQWAAGTGTDAAPYFRIFNPVLQSRQFDPEGHFIRRWVPELAALPTEYLHAPWQMPLEVQRRFGVRIGHDYPAPLVDHALARARALAVFRRVSG
ncbi:deoxyribodipyrimidine photo-lyase [Thermanaerothrix sp. 4228-RoL]|uniref:Deoxyribodipyrimidine photo-lyase n=1 Tax=Thermanaerothrix solaris TaxID=3058434 RepID=A0ABU3NQY8_9CHLR|nr:deoxyribodipyrimidine photo-lyase [Thermanaerothrix sp. 4228-RoL]MDT8898472.1 deoxyribodipyrimidine photo-lyase [Thermanaerothrix sp. 4228-RoL]